MRALNNYQQLKNSIIPIIENKLSLKNREPENWKTTLNPYFREFDLDVVTKQIVLLYSLQITY